MEVEFVEKETEAVVGEGGCYYEFLIKEEELMYYEFYQQEVELKEAAWIEFVITSSTNKWWSSRGTAWICRWSMLSCSQCFSRPSRWGRVSKPRPGQLQNIM